MRQLTEAALRATRSKEKAYKLKDDRGLYLLVQPSGGRLWRLRFSLGGRESMISLGSYPDVSLKVARERQDDARKLIAAGINPSIQRRVAKSAQADTFEAIAREWLELQRRKMAKSTQTKTKWVLEDLLFPHIGSLPVSGIEPPDLLAAIRKTEARGRHESAHRAKQTAGQIFRYAIATGRARRDPSADLRDALAPIVSRRRAAITDPAAIGPLLRALDGYEGQPATTIALQLAPLVFVRPGELRYARWEEFNLAGAQPEWRIPESRMKMRRVHIVPLSTQAVALLKKLAAIEGSKGLLFPSLRSGARPISENTLNAALRRLGYSKDDMTAHGFRAMASTCLNEQGFPPDVIELQLAHVERNKVRAAYNRALHLAERRKMMQSWADYLDELRAAGQKSHRPRYAA